MGFFQIFPVLKNAIQGQDHGFGGKRFLDVIPRAVFNGQFSPVGVAVSGVEIGYVESLRLESDKALVTARLSSSAGLRKNIRATVRSKSLLGEKYLEVIPAGENAPLLESGDLVTNTASPVQIDQVISWIGGLLEGIDSQKAAQLLAALDQDPAALRRIIQNMDELLAKLSSLDADQLKEFVEQLSVRARLF